MIARHSMPEIRYYQQRLRQARRLLQTNETKTIVAGPCGACSRVIRLGCSYRIWNLFSIIIFNQYKSSVVRATSGAHNSGRRGCIKPMSDEVQVFVSLYVGAHVSSPTETFSESTESRIRPSKSPKGAEFVDLSHFK